MLGSPYVPTVVHQPCNLGMQFQREQGTMKGFPVNLTVAKYSAIWLCMSATLTIVRFRFGAYVDYCAWDLNLQSSVCYVDILN